MLTPRSLPTTKRQCTSHAYFTADTPNSSANATFNAYSPDCSANSVGDGCSYEVQDENSDTARMLPLEPVGADAV